MSEATGSAEAGNPKPKGFGADMNARTRLDKIEAALKELSGFCGAFVTLLEQQKNTLPSNFIPLAEAVKVQAGKVKEALDG